MSSKLYELVTAQNAPSEVLKEAGLELIKRSVEEGDYPLLLRLNEERALLSNIRIALHGKTEAAALQAIDTAYSNGDFALLADMSEDTRLPQAIRDRASGRIDYLLRQDAPVYIDAEMIARYDSLSRRLGVHPSTPRGSSPTEYRFVFARRTGPQ